MNDELKKKTAPKSQITSKTGLFPLDGGNFITTTILRKKIHCIDYILAFSKFAPWLAL